MTLPVTEIFGPTIQGEGPSVGRRASFVRLGGCNLTCSWCDTPYTWDSTRFDLRAEITPMPIGAILELVGKHDTGLTVITGGEPLLYQQRPDFAALVESLHDLADVEIETNGTIAPDPVQAEYVRRYNVSPKLAHSGNRHTASAVLDAFDATGVAVFKFVAATVGDLDEVHALVGRTHIRAEQVWISPLGDTVEDVLTVSRTLVGPVIERGWNLSMRAHVLLWGGVRGR